MQGGADGYEQSADCKMSLTLREKLERFPPIACRLLARRRLSKGARAVSDEELAASSGLPMATIKSISWSHSWDNIPVAHMLAFTRACNIDLESRRCLWRHQLYVRSGAFTHLRNSPQWDTLFVPLIEEWNNKP